MYKSQTMIWTSPKNLKKTLTKGMYTEDDLNAKIQEVKASMRNCKRVKWETSKTTNWLMTHYQTNMQNKQTLKDKKKNLLNVMLEQGFKSSSFDEGFKIKNKSIWWWTWWHQSSSKSKRTFLVKVYFEESKGQAPNEGSFEPKKADDTSKNSYHKKYKN